MNPEKHNPGITLETTAEALSFDALRAILIEQNYGVKPVEVITPPAPKPRTPAENAAALQQYTNQKKLPRSMRKM